MARAVYIVLLSRGKWWVDYEGRAYGPFSTKDIAKHEAISLARFLAHAGRQSEVRVPDDNGKWWMEWESAPDARWSVWNPELKKPDLVSGASSAPAAASPPQSAP